MIGLQAINYILENKDIGFALHNGLTAEHFVGYEDCFQFILEHFEKYNTVPDKATFINEFENFDFVEVSETEKYLLDTLKEEYTYVKVVPILQKSAQILTNKDSSGAVEYLMTELKNLDTISNVDGVDILSQADLRYEEFLQRKESGGAFSISSGFPELDRIIKGWQCGEEFIVVLARTGQGKTWILLKFLEGGIKQGKNVGFISPEMSPSKVGYRFDTLHGNFSNSGLLWGELEDADNYADYIKQLETHGSKFVVAMPRDFNKKITVSKLRAFVEKHNLDMLAIDGITYLQDERARKGDSRSTMLTNISEDLMQLSCELGIPVMVCSQSNRDAVKKDSNKSEAPDLEHIRDSDGISYNATRVISIKQEQDEIVSLSLKKNRYGEMGAKILYQWKIDTGTFEYVPSDDDGVDEVLRKHQKEELKKLGAKDCIF